MQEILCNSLKTKELLADLGNFSYDGGVTEVEFWRAVGQRLAANRKKQRASVSGIEQNGGPTNKTIQEIEAGNVGQLSKLRDYARILEVDLVDVFRTVLQAEDDQSEELQFVIRQFKRAGVKGRAAFVQVAHLAEDRSEPPPLGLPGDHSARPTRTTSVDAGAAKPRGAK